MNSDIQNGKCSSWWMSHMVRVNHHHFENFFSFPIWSNNIKRGRKKVSQMSLYDVNLLKQQQQQ